MTSSLLCPSSSSSFFVAMSCLLCSSSSFFDCHFTFSSSIPPSFCYAQAHHIAFDRITGRSQRNRRFQRQTHDCIRRRHDNRTWVKWLQTHGRRTWIHSDLVPTRMFVCYFVCLTDSCDSINFFFILRNFLRADLPEKKSEKLKNHASLRVAWDKKLSNRIFAY